ncbi:hypothetical protein WUBG_02468 [Wuchereria bancrofti]|uniref:Uncharacterized protein n=1 Tax=Wuchereria bancrofti TaxID=6293 RepID=J9FAQ1_WUCBA|nr:hypothetical protein WUBG_02468 [Wuchereria bancrofti]
MKQSKQIRDTATAEKIQSNQESSSWLTNKKKRLCIFCNKNPNSTVEQRIDRKTANCFYCKKSHNSACTTKTQKSKQPKDSGIDKGKVVIKNANISVNSNTKMEGK